jgi:sugar phosphate permease
MGSPIDSGQHNCPAPAEARRAAARGSCRGWPIGRSIFGSQIRWQIAGLLCVITTINYLDRQAFAVAAPALVAEFGIDNTEFGTITAAFLFCYGIGHLIAGPFIDRVGTRAAFKLAVIAWSIAGFLHAFGAASSASLPVVPCSV